MAKMTPSATLDLALAKIQEADMAAACSQQPATFHQAVQPDMWVANTVYVAGAVVRPPTDNGFVYECMVGGTSGNTEPPWGTTQDNTFSDNDITWKAHENFSLAAIGLDAGDKTIADKVGGGRVLTFAEKTGAISHRAGTISHTAYVNRAAKTIEMITTASTTTPADNDILAGRTVIFHELHVNLALS